MPKIIVNIWFFSINHVGYGGDSRAYRVLGHDIAYVAQSKMDFADNGVVNADSENEEFKDYHGMVWQFQSLLDGDLAGLRNNNIPIILFHSLIYLFFFHSDFIYLIIVNIFTSLALFLLIKRFHIKGLMLLILILNPFSLYYGSTHMKEGLIEPVLLFIFYFFSVKNNLGLFFAFSLLFFFRMEFGLIVLCSFLISYFFKRVPLLFHVPVILFLLSFLDSNIYRNWLISFSLPLPFIYDINYEFPTGIFQNLQGFYNVYILFIVFRSFLVKNNYFIHFIFYTTAILSLNGQGMIGMKDRFIASFISVFLIMLMISARNRSKINHT